jgi:hypothetical protein
MRQTLCALLLAACVPMTANAQEDTRQLVQLPEHMQHHMLANMRNHLETLNAVLADLAAGKGDAAADLAEARLGMSSLTTHGASRMAAFMPQAMQDTGTEMHHAASRFARVAREGDALRSYAALQDVTAQCVACHSGYRIR